MKRLSKGLAAWFGRWVRRARYLRHRGRAEREMDEEFRFHVEMETERYIREGLAPEEAKRRAVLAFGGVERFKEESRDARGTRWLEDLAADVRYGARTLIGRPGFTAAVVLTLALGIGANTALFSIIDGIFLEPLPFAQPDRLVRVWPEGALPRGGIELLRERSDAYEAVVAFGAPSSVSLTGHGAPERLQAVEVTPDLFSTLGAEAALGRTLVRGEERPGRGRIVVLSHGLWERRFGADPGIVGETIALDGVPRTVVGVMPEDFRFPSRDAELWIPATFDPADPGEYWGMGYLYTVGRLEPGVALERAQTELDALIPEVRAAFPWTMPDEWGREAGVVPLREAVTGDVRPMLLALLGAVGLVLLIACVNVANLLLARAAARRREVAVRTALGAGRGRLVRQFLTESMLLALAGGGAGVLFAFWGLPALVAALPPGVPRVEEIGVDLPVLGFGVALTLLTGLVVGAAPALRAARADTGDMLGERGRGSDAGRGHGRTSAALVVTEVALAVVLVVAAGLLIRSFSHMLRVDPGFQTEHVLAATVAPPEFRYEDDAGRRAFYGRLQERLEALPGARAAAVGSGVPFAGGSYGSVFLIEGRPDPSESGDWPLAEALSIVSPGYFRALGIPVLDGRAFTDADRDGTRGVAVVSRGLAERYWPGGDAVGKRIRRVDDEEWRTIVGVVGDVKWDELTTARGTGLYIPLLQGPAGPARVVVRTATGADAVAANLRSVVRSLDEDTPVTDIRTMDAFIADSVAEPRFATVLVTLFAAVALALGAIGVYGVMAYTVSRRTREIGVRMALGARSGEVLRLVLRRGLLLALVGTVLGVVAAFGATRALSGMLFGVSATDPLTFASVGGVLVLVALVASYLPARRAARVDPVTALRCE